MKVHIKKVAVYLKKKGGGLKRYLPLRAGFALPILL